LLFLICLFYFLPAGMAWGRKHNNLSSIFMLNLLLGWTVIGWIVAIIWAVSSNRAGSTTAS
jgi:hypothetical protein